MSIYNSFCSPESFDEPTPNWILVLPRNAAEAFQLLITTQSPRLLLASSIRSVSPLLSVWQVVSSARMGYFKHEYYVWS